jgi:hypothetical protein
MNYEFNYLEPRMYYNFYTDVSKISDKISDSLPSEEILYIYDYNYISELYSTKNTSKSHIKLDGFFQFDYIYLKNKNKIIEQIKKNKDVHRIIYYDNNSIALKDIIDPIELPKSKIYDVVIHIRLNDFYGLIDYIEVEYYLQLFKNIISEFHDKRIAIVTEQLIEKNDIDYLLKCLSWFIENNFSIHHESNDLLTDFTIMKNAKTLVCSMSTFSWIAAYLSEGIEKCYMPNYNYYRNGRQFAFFKRPIENTVLYPIKTTKFQNIKATIVKNKEEDADKLSIKLSTIGIQTEIVNIELAKDINNLTLHNNNCYIKTKHHLIINDVVQSVINLDKLYDMLDNIPDTYEIIPFDSSDSSDSSIYDDTTIDVKNKAYLVYNDQLC